MDVSPGRPASRLKRKGDAVITFGDAQWDAKDRRLTVRGERVKLSWRFAECLSILVEAGGSVVTKEQLQQQIWNGAMVEESNLAQCITALRKALDPVPDGGSYIETVPRVGYRMAVAIHRPAAEPPQRVRRAIPRYAYVGGSLVLALSGFALQRVSAHYANLEQARELTMRGLAIVRTGNQAEGTKSAPVFQQALELVPDYPLALAGVAEGDGPLWADLLWRSHRTGGQSGGVGPLLRRMPSDPGLHPDDAGLEVEGGRTASGAFD